MSTSSYFTHVLLDDENSGVLAVSKTLPLIQFLSAGIMDTSLKSILTYGPNTKDVAAWLEENRSTILEKNKALVADKVLDIQIENITENFLQKKRLVQLRIQLFQYLIAITDIYIAMHSYNTSDIFDLTTSEILKNDELLELYAAGRMLPANEARKELEMKHQTRISTLVRLQGNIDRQVNEINSIETQSQALKMYATLKEFYVNKI
jgi:hypothetical protein